MINAITIAALALSALPQQHSEDGRGQDLFDAKWHAERRSQLLDHFADKAPGVIILRGKGANPDYREFRQDNNFWYFTGITTPNAILVMTTDTRKEYLFVPAVGSNDERWQGDLVDPDEAREITGIKNCLELGGNSKDFGIALGDLRKKYAVAYMQRQPAENWMMSRDNLQSAVREMMANPYDSGKHREARFSDKLKELHDFEVKDISVTLDALRVIKTSEEIEAMRMACVASGAGHTAVMSSSMPGDYEWQLASRMMYEFQVAGGMGQGGYAAIVASELNACTLHYNENSRALGNNEVIMIDYGAEYNHYVADISRTWPTGKKFTKRQREVYQAVYDAQEAAFKLCKPGSTLRAVSNAAQKVITERGFGNMWHGTSHWLGMATHDVGRFGAKLEPGMVFTVEPGIYLPDEKMGVRIEDVVVITEDGYELISSAIPRSIKDIEALRAQAYANK
jgi:Xaa-Pro aminopeptidase